MNALFANPAKAYRKIELDARIEASSGIGLTVICLEEAIADLGLALRALDRDRMMPPVEPLSRAHGIALYLARTVDPASPLGDAMVQFYGGLAATIASNMRSASASEIARVRDDFADILAAAKTGGPS